MIRDFDSAYMDFNVQRDYPAAAQDEPSMDGVQLAAGPSPVVSDAGAAFGVYPGMGKRSQKSTIGERMITGAPDFTAGALREGTAAGLGFGGDMQKIGRFIGALATDNEGGTLMEKIGRAGKAMEGPTLLPSSEEVSKEGFTIPGTDITIPLPPAVPPGTSALGLTPEERQSAAEAGGVVGEMVGDPFLLAKGGQLAVKGAMAAGKALAPKAGEMVIKSMDKLGTPVMMNAVPPGPSAAGAATKAMAPASDIGFYSAVEKAALNVQRNSGSGQAFLNDITKGENVKLDEIKWMGLDDFLKGKKNVTKQEVQDFVQNNRVDVQEVTLGGAQQYDAQRLTQLESEYKALKDHPIDDPSFGENKYDEMIRLMNIRDQSTVSSLYDAAENAMRSAQRAQQQGNKLTAEKYWKENELLNTRAEKLDLEGQGMKNPPKYGKYTLPGGENYREILLTMPVSGNESSRLNEIANKLFGKPYTDLMADTTEMAKMRLSVKREYKTLYGESGKSAEDKAMYRSSHWDQPNVLAHIRVNDRVDADGKKMLLIEEVQSDWHQAGREKGYENPKVEERRKELEKLAWPYMEANKPIPADIKAEIDALPPIMEKGVPEAPFKDTWYQLALKRALRYAADNGYDRVGLTTGKQQAERYDLAKQVDEVIAKRNEDGTFNISATMVDGGGSEQSIGKNIPVDKLPDYVGKDLAKSIQAQEFGTDVYSGDQLKVGGEGMKKYYDDIYPKYLDKYGKKWGASVGETRIKTGRGVLGGEPVRYLDITPEMRKSVQKGQPLAAVSSETTVA